LFFALPVQAGCRPVSFHNNGFTVCVFDAGTEKISLFNLDSAGQPYGGFERLGQELGGNSQHLVFAMNAGMFDTSLRPIGLYVEGGRQLRKLNRQNGSGNFALKPNGVFYVAGSKAGVMESEAFAHSGIKPDFATQSGPMLVINGAIHPRISPAGTSAKVRNGVGMTDDHTVIFAISDSFVTFYDFASLFRDQLNCRNALFLDGSVSSLYAPELGRSDFLTRIGPIVAVTQAH
jgi:uncharacterized protein YigE (DUF2233 family)